MPILHIVHDEKFIDIAYRLFEESSPKNNTFIIISAPHKLNFIKFTPVCFVTRKESVNRRFLESLNHFDMVVLHCMDAIKMEILALADNTVKFVWIGWGIDYYDLITGDLNKLLLPKTLALNKNNFLLNSYSTLRIKTKKMIKKYITGRYIDKFKLVNRINYFSPVLYEDYELVKSALPDFNAQYVPWNYGNLEDDLIKGYEEATITGDNILLGNSSFPSNNHLDIFDNIDLIGLADRKIICPLNYGDYDYRKVVTLEGAKRFGSNFVPLNDYMSINDYVKLIKTCSLVVMGHLRQQALGNIIIMMYLGAKVFLDKNNPIYIFFNKESAHIFSLEQLPFESNTRLNYASIKHNQDVLHRHWSRSAISVKTKELIKKVACN